MNRGQVDRLVLDDDDDDDEPEENASWMQTTNSNRNEHIRQLLAHRQQLKKQRADIQKCLASVNKELVSGIDSQFTTSISDTPKLSRDNGDADRTDTQSSKVKKLRDEYVKYGGRHPGVLEQMRTLEIEAKLKDDKKEMQKMLLKTDGVCQESRKTQMPPKWTHRNRNESMEDQRWDLIQQITKLETGNQYLQSQLNMLLPSCIPQIREYSSLKDANKKYHQELTLLQQKIELVKRQKELNKHEKELQEIIASHTRKPVQFRTISKLTSNRNILPFRNEVLDVYAHCDFISGLPLDVTQCSVVLHLFSESSMVRIEGIPMSPVNCIMKRNPDNTFCGRNDPFEVFAFIGKKQKIASYLQCPNLCLVVEIQVHKNVSSESSQEYFQTQAWTKINVLDVHLQPLIGKFFVPLKIFPVIARLSKSQFDAVPQFWKAEFYYQISTNDSIPDPLEVINKNSYNPVHQAPVYYPKTRNYEPLPPPPPPPPPRETPSNLGYEGHSLQHPTFAANLSRINFSFVIYWVKGAKSMSGKLVLTAFHPEQKKIVECLSGPVILETDYVETKYRYGYHMFGDLHASFLDVDVDKNIIILAKFYQLQEKHEYFQVKNMLKDVPLKDSLAAWTALPLLKDSNQDFVPGSTFYVLNKGPHSLQLYSPPIPNLSNILDNREGRQWKKYGNAIIHIDILAGTERPSLESTSYDQKIERGLEGRDLNFYYILVKESSPPLEDFVADSGFDIYIDACRFLPDSVSYTRIAGRIVDRNYKKYAGDISAVAKMNSDIFNPIYEHKEEYRESDPPITATLLLKVYSKNAETKGLIVVGFAAINIFVELGTNRQPTSNSSTAQVSLNEGAFQLRLYCQGPDYISPMSASYFINHDVRSIPCATILVRIRKAPTDGMGAVLSCNQVPKEEWTRFGVWEDAYDYSDGLYISTSCTPTSSEMHIFPALLSRPIQMVSEAIKVLPNTSLNEKLKESTNNLEKYVKNQLIKGLDEIPVNLDLNKISRYQPEWGIKVAVDAASKLPWSGFTLAHISLNPPALFYKKIFSYRADKLKFVETLDFERSTNKSPVWKDGFKNFSSRSFNPDLTVIIHLREIHTKPTTGETYKFSLLEEAWTVVHVFTKQYAVTEPFQLPLFHGAPPVAILNQLNSQSCHECINENILKGNINHLANASVFVRICDARRSDELPRNVYGQQKIATNKSYLTLKSGKYDAKENPGKPIRSLVPSHREPEEFLLSVAKHFKKLVHKMVKEGEV